MKTILLTSSLLILLLAALGPLLRGRIKPQVQYALWLLVALRLLIPVNLGSSALSALAVLDRIEQPPVLERISQTPISIRSYDSTYREIAGEYRRRGADPDTLPAGDLANLEAQARALAEQVPLSELVVRWAKPLWLGGAAAMGAWFLAVNGLFRRRAGADGVPSAGICVRRPDLPLPERVLPACGVCHSRRSGGPHPAAPCSRPRGDPLPPQRPLVGGAAVPVPVSLLVQSSGVVGGLAQPPGLRTGL